MEPDSLFKLNVFILILVAWCVPWWVYNRFIRTKDFHPMGKQVLPTPHWVSCGIPYVSHNPKKNNCKNVKIDGWSVGHVLIYATIGFFFPSHLLAVSALSIVCEIFEYVVGWRARWILDPLTNIAGYVLGIFLAAVLGIELARPGPRNHLASPAATAVLLALLALLLFMNRPAMMPRGQEFY